MAGVSYETLSTNFAKVCREVPVVGSIIGGKVEQNIKSGFFNNACAIRLSYAFNYSGLPISRYDGSVSSGRDKKWYLYKVADMISFVEKHIGGQPIKGHELKDFLGKKGIIIFLDCNWRDATGHVDLFNGKNVEYHSYFNKCNTVLLYVLK